ncbi:50S ribosomal protein L23 [Candidatus Mycoplasma haematominutum]|uniref:50S ribosomal protein L23 n=1 Tax=Candidatus Mycoplasma haematominutum 'Birmingham 1' TaxID=1116213 RepID=G8C316_9MOLU|nr:50S ribosomal protein L23 [Candidatus Mycoplasma haematominutum]CCE66714.1 ribosomal protein L23 [Candidatus Mycoplasma haematominutum 'Birmingham 1']
MELINVIREPYTPGKRFGNKTQTTFVLAFIVDRNANKIMIRKAFKAIFGVRVKSVNTLVKHPQPTRVTKYGRHNFTKARKIAYISLTKEDFLNLKKEIEGAEAVEEELLKESKEVVEVKTVPTNTETVQGIKEKELAKAEKQVEKIKSEGNAD